MESPVLTLVVALFLTVNVESHLPQIESSLHPPRPPPPQLPESPPPRLIQPPPIRLPPPSTPHRELRPPPLTLTQPLPPPRAPVPPPRPLSRSTSPRLQLPPPSSHTPPPPPRKQTLPEHGNNKSNKNLSPPLERAKPNIGKKIGLMFIGVAAILQFCILAFLLIRRRQLLRKEYSN